MSLFSATTASDDESCNINYQTACRMVFGNKERSMCPATASRYDGRIGLSALICHELHV